MQKKSVVIIHRILLLLAAYVLYAALEHSSLAITKVDSPVKVEQTAKVCGADKSVIVTHIIDGDTVVVSGEYHVRLLGINADEIGDTCYQAAKLRLQQLVLNKQVTLEKDISDVDKYGRCLRNIFLDNENVSVVLAREGLAKKAYYAPDGKYRNDIFIAQSEAVKNNIGCQWSKK